MEIKINFPLMESFPIVKIRPFRYGNEKNNNMIKLDKEYLLLKSDRFGMEIFCVNSLWNCVLIVKLKSDRFGMEIL